MNVHYDLLTWEGDILRLQFWARAFEMLKEKGAVFLQTQGRLAGCWVMTIEDEAGAAAAERRDAEAGSPARTKSREKVIVRSNGTVTYVGKDIAYQFWKFGLLGRDFHYRVFSRREDGQPLWATCGRGRAATRQATRRSAAPAPCLQRDRRPPVVPAEAAQAGARGDWPHARQADRSVHFSYEMVALSHDTARQLGYTLSAEDAARPFVEVSGRKGLGVKADDLLDVLEKKAGEEVAKRNAELSADETRRIAEAIAIAAVRYFMIRVLPREGDRVRHRRGAEFRG